MAVALEQFVKQLEDSGILAGETLKDFIPPKGSPKNAEDLANMVAKVAEIKRQRQGRLLAWRRNFLFDSIYFVFMGVPV